MNYLRLGLSVLGGILIALVLYGAFQYYFKKPTPIVNNTTVSPGATLNVEQAKIVKSSGHLITGIYGGNKSYGISVGWIW